MSDSRHPIDVHVGSRVRRARVARGLSQAALGEAIGRTFQQIQRYEKGINRISASILYEIAKSFKLDTSYFFLGDDEIVSSETDALNGSAKISDLDTMILKLISKIKKEETKEKIYYFITELIKSDGK